jgi:hypothetical protein
VSSERAITASNHPQIREESPFFAQLADPLNNPLGTFASAALEDDGHGTADLFLNPGAADQGTYKLTVAAFDEAGGITQQQITLTIGDSLLSGDANCDGNVDRMDRDALAHALFDAQSTCTLADANDDGAITAADLVALSVGLGG